MKLLRYAVTIAFASLLSACGGGSGGGDGEKVEVTENDPPLGYQTPVGVGVCSTEDIMGRVDFDMRDYYLYYDQVPSLRFSDYDSPETLMKDLRVDPDVYSYVTDAADLNALTQTGRKGGFGFWFMPTPTKEVRIRQVLDGSPADQAGMLRGDLVLEINGILSADITRTELNEALDPDNAPLLLTLQTGDDDSRIVSVNFEEFKWYTADRVQYYTRSGYSDSPAVGYISVQSFLATTYDEIDSSLDYLASNVDIDELIVDLRYNTGGYIYVAKHLAALVGGAAVANKPFYLQKYNDKYSFYNEAEYFDEVDNALDLPRVFVLVTNESASASEMFINSLEPYIDVVVIGSQTRGKPYTSQTREYCGKAINAMQTIGTNAVGVDVGFGIEPDCLVEDNWEEEAESVTDPLTSGALNYVVTETCPTRVAAGPLLRNNSSESDVSFREPQLVLPGK